MFDYCIIIVVGDMLVLLVAQSVHQPMLWLCSHAIFESKGVPICCKLSQMFLVREPKNPIVILLL